MRAMRGRTDREEFALVFVFSSDIAFRLIKNISELETVYQKFDHAQFLTLDPIGFVHRYKNPLDQEVVGVFAALLAYGRVETIRGSIEKVLNVFHALGPSPSQVMTTIEEADLDRELRTRLSGFTHRFNTGSDVRVLARLVRETLLEYGSLGRFFREKRGDSDPTIQRTLAGAIQDWSTRARRLRAAPSFYFFLTDPTRGSACKRWNMFLRWMIRHDRIDLGIWGPKRGGAFHPRELVLPLDVHTWRLCQTLGFSKMRTPNWKAALEITARFREINAEDPVRFDFALCHLGMIQYRKGKRE